MKKLLFRTLLLAGLVAAVAACNSGSAGSGSKSEIKCETTDVPGEIGGIYTAGDYLIDSRGHVCVSITRNDSVPKVDMAKVGTSKHDKKKYILTLVLEALDEQGNVVDDDDNKRDALVEMKTSDNCLCSFYIGEDIAKTKSFRLKTVLKKNDKVKDDVDKIIDDVNDVLGMD
ncbi:MAG: hypothetical protein ACI30W_03100 [Muribaculaceae bacterium]